MANHLTPDELSKRGSASTGRVIRVCIEEGVPIYQGKIDKTLFGAAAGARRHAPKRTELATQSGIRSGSRSRRPEGALRARTWLPSRGFAWTRTGLFGAAFFWRRRSPCLADLASSTLRRSALIESTVGPPPPAPAPSRSPHRRASPRAARAGRDGSRSAPTGRTRRQGSRSPAGRARARLLHRGLLDRLLDLGLRVDVGGEQRLERERIALWPDQAELLLALLHEPAERRHSALVHRVEAGRTASAPPAPGRGRGSRAVEDRVDLGRVHEHG